MKELEMENGDVVDKTTCDHNGGDAVINRPGTNPFCRICGTINPEVES